MEFDVKEFLKEYPEFLELNENKINMLYVTAKILGKKVIDTAVSIVKNIDDKIIQEKNWTYLVLAHLCQIQINNFVGRLNSATQGSISTSFEMSDSDSASFWNQTIYGAQCVQLLKTKPVFKYIF